MLHVPLPHVYAVRTQHTCCFYIVVDDAGNAGAAADVDERVGELDQALCCAVLFPNLQHGDAAVNGCADVFCELGAWFCDGV